jgi:hypothetical protein
MVPLPPLKPHRFSQVRHQVIYAAVYSQARRHLPYDLATVAAWLRQQGQIEQAGGVPYLASLLDEAGPVAAIEGYAALITEAAARRVCARIGKSLEALAEDDPGHRASESLVTRFAVIKRRVESVMAFRPDKGGLKSEQAGDVYRRSESGPPWLMAPWVAERDLVVCVGEQGLGKSWMALQFGVCLASGHPMLDSVPRQPRRVLYVDAENNPGLVTYRLRRLVNGLGFGTDDVDRMPLWFADVSKTGLALDTEEGIAMLDEECRMRQPEVVILDSFMDFQDLEENSNTEMKKWINRTLRPFAAKHNLTILALHHMSKPNAADGRSAMHRGRGASAITGIPDQVWSFGEENDQLVLRHEKGRWGKEAGPIALTFEDVNEGTGCRMSLSDFDESALLAVIDVMRDLGGGGITRKALATAVSARAGEDVNQRTLQRTCTRLIREGRMTRQRNAREAVYFWAAD